MNGENKSGRSSAIWRDSWAYPLASFAGLARRCGVIAWLAVVLCLAGGVAFVMRAVARGWRAVFGKSG